MIKDRCNDHSSLSPGIVTLNDLSGAIQDHRQVAQLNRERGDSKSLQDTRNQLKKLGATE